MARSIFTLLAAFLLLAFPDASQAWTPPGERIVDQWSKAYQRYGSITITGTVKQGATELPFTVTRDASGLRLEQNGKPVADPATKTVWKVLLTPRREMDHWRNQGYLSYEQTGFARSNGQIAYTLGVKGEKKEGVQVWVDRRRLTPLFAALPAEVKPGAMVVYSGYAESTNHAFPSSIILRAPNGLGRTWSVKEIRATR